MPASRFAISRLRRRAPSALPWGCGLALAGALLGCGLQHPSGPKAGRRARIEPRDTQLVHEDCPVSGAGATAEDINGDGRPDRRTVSSEGRPRCSTLDFNFDGVSDAWVYFDASGQVRRRENDYDRDGNVDEVSSYAGGVLVEQQRSTSRAGKVDTWHYFSAGKMARTERDSNGDDYIDQWWEYPEQRSTDCPLIHSDVDGDGQPDPGATVDVCRDGDPATAIASDPDAPPPSGVSEVPTEIETPVEMPPGGSEPAPSAPAEAP